VVTMNVFFTYDENIHETVHSNGEVTSRFRLPKDWFNLLVDPYRKYPRVSIQNLENNVPEDCYIIHEIHTERSPHDWMGYAVRGSVNIVEMIPEWLLEKVRNKTAILYYDQSCEGFALNSARIDLYRVFHQLFNDYNLPPSQIIYSTGNLIENEVYRAWCTEHNISECMNVVGVNMFAHTFANGYIFSTDDSQISCTDHLKYKAKNDIKLFNSLNRVVRDHRVAMTSMLNYYNLVDDNLVSQDKYPAYYATEFSPWQREFDPHPAFEHSNMVNINSKLPLVLDTNQFEINKATHFFKEVYLDSWISLITETYCTELNTDTIFFSEKIYKPIRARQPFILVGQYNALSKLKDEGFMTFSEFWDESYDTIENNTLRLEAICLLLKDLSKLSKPQWLAMYMKMMPILEHNMNLLNNKNWVTPMHRFVDNHPILKGLS